MPQFPENYQPSVLEGFEIGLKYHQIRESQCAENIRTCLGLIDPYCLRQLSKALRQSVDSIKKSLEETLAREQAEFNLHQEFVTGLKGDIRACAVSDQQIFELEGTMLFLHDAISKRSPKTRVRALKPIRGGYTMLRAIQDTELH